MTNEKNRNNNEGHRMGYLEPVEPVIKEPEKVITVNGESFKTSADVMEAFSLNFEVELRNVSRPLNNGKTIAIPGSFCTVRKDTDQVLGVVGGRYNVIQNRNMFNMFDALVQQGEMEYLKAGETKGGSRVYIEARIPNDLLIKENGKDDIIEKRLLLSSSHDGSMGISVDIMPYRLVCSNGLVAAVGVSRCVYSKHTEHAIRRIDQQIEVLQEVNAQFKALQPVFQAMADTTITNEKQVKRYIEMVLPSNVDSKTHNYVKPSTRLTNMRQKFYEFYRYDNTIKRGTVWGVYNAVTGYIDNEKQFKTEDKRINSIYYGSGAETKRTAQIVAAALTSREAIPEITPEIRSDIISEGKRVITGYVRINN